MQSSVTKSKGFKNLCDRGYLPAVFSFKRRGIVFHKQYKCIVLPKRKLPTSTCTKHFFNDASCCNDTGFVSLFKICGLYFNVILSLQVFSFMSLKGHG